MDTIKAVAIIPARGGSKRLPRKNALSLHGKPLIVRTIEAAINSACFDKIIFSSDDEELLSIASDYSVECQKRPAELASDTSKVIELVNFLANQNDIKKQFNVISLLLPTCPLRRPEDIKNGFKKFDSSVDSIVSMTSFDFPPQLSMKPGKNGLLEPVFEPCALITGDTRSQDQDEILHPNGGFYISWLDKFIVNKNFFAGKVKAYKMDRRYSADVDTLEDFKYAEYLINQGGLK